MRGGGGAACVVAQDAARDAAGEAYDRTEVLDADVAANAALAASSVAPSVRIHSELLESTRYAARALAMVAVGPDGTRSAFEEAFAASLARLARFVRTQRWPSRYPTLAQLEAATEALRVAWDLVASDPRSDHTIAELLEAHARAERLDRHRVGFDWGAPVPRTIAEGASDEGRVRTLLDIVA